MFQGATPSALRSLLAEIVQGWAVDELWGGCAGNFTIQRTLPRIRHHCSDVTLYTSAIGWWASGAQVPVTLKPESAAVLDWVEEFLTGPVEVAAAVMLLSNMAGSIGQENVYHRRQVSAYRGQFRALHAKTVSALERSRPNIVSYAARDVVDWLDEVPDDAGFVAVLPAAGDSVQATWSALERHFDWPAPEFSRLTGERVDLLARRLAKRPRWALAVQGEIDGMDDFLRSRVQTSAFGPKVSLYASTGPARVVAPRQLISPFRGPRLAPDEVLTGRERISLVHLTAREFSWLRAQHLDAKIAPATPQYAYGVLLDGKLAGCVAFNQSDFRMGAHSAYLLSDFPVAPVRYRRLASLMGMVAQSREVKMLLERAMMRRVDDIVTTAFTDNLVSMKYRTAKLEMVGRKAATDGKHKFQLQYQAPTGRWSIREAYADWYGKQSKFVEGEKGEQS